jgi:hypothetical protein
MSKPTIRMLTSISGFDRKGQPFDFGAKAETSHFSAKEAARLIASGQAELVAGKAPIETATRKAPESRAAGPRRGRVAAAAARVAAAVTGKPRG